MGRHILTKSVRKFLRRKKSEIRRQFLDSVVAEEKIQDLTKAFFDENRKKATASA